MAPVVYGASPSGARDAQAEAVLLDRFAREDPELAHVAAGTTQDGEKLILAGKYSVFEATAAWRVYYDHAAQRFRERFGYLPLARARALAAYARALNERERVKRRATGDLPR